VRLAVLLATLLACGGEGAPDLPAPGRGAGLPGPRSGGTLRISLVEDVQTLDPAIAYNEMSYQVQHFLFDTLVAFAPAESADPLEIVPQLAESWTVSADLLTYTFTLREGLKYGDGSPIVADDFIVSFERVLDPTLSSGGMGLYKVIEGGAERNAGTTDKVSGLRALDDRHLEIRLSRPDSSFIFLLPMKFITPVPRRWAAKHGNRLREHVLASGPFRLVEWREGSLLRLERNPYYWKKGTPYLDAVTIDLAVPRDVNVLRLLSGEYDAVDRLSPDKYIQLMKSPVWKDAVRLVPGNSSYGEALNVTRPPFSDKRVRQAMNYAIDKRKTIRIYNNRAQISHGILPPAMPGFVTDRAPYPYDPDKARQLLREAGYADGFDITYYMLNDELYTHIASSMQADLAKVGVRMKIQVLSFPTYLQAIGKHELSFAFTAWVMDFPHPRNFMETKFHSRSISRQNSSNETGWSSPETDRLMDQALLETDPEKSLALYRQAEAIIFDEAPWLWHYHPLTTEVVQPYVRNYTFHPVHLRDFREAWLDRRETRAP
jgi:ABC-type transport system substrate-binding protein